MSGDLLARAESRERLRLEPTTTPGAVRQGISWRLLGIILLLTVLAALAGAAIYAYNAEVRTSGEVIAPLIKAEAGEIKHKPNDPGGMEPPHQDKLIFDRVAPVQARPAEHLRPAPEEPLRSATAPEPEGEPATWVSEDEAPAAGTPGAPPPQVAAAPDAERAQTPEALGQGAPAEPEAPPARTESLMPRPPDAKPAAAEESASAPAEPASADKPPAKSAAAPDAPASTTAPAAAPRQLASPPAEPAPAPAAEKKPAEPAPIQETARAGYRVQIVALRTEALADRAWRELAKAHGDLLGDLQHFIERADLGKERGIFYRVQVGPFPGKPEADALCAALRRQSASCLVVGGR